MREKTYFYLAKFFIHKGCRQGQRKCIAINIEASNKKEARKILEETWQTGYDWPRFSTTSRYPWPHQYGIKIIRLKPGDEWLYEWFCPISQEEYHDAKGGLKYER